MPRTGESGDSRHARMVQKLEDTTEPMRHGGAGDLFGSNAAYNAAASKRNEQRRRALVGDAGPRNKVEDNFNRVTGQTPSSVSRPTGLPPGMDMSQVQDPGEEAVSPEEQKQYDKIVRFAANLIYKNPKQTVAAMNQSDLPIHQAVGRHAANLAKVIEQTAKANKEELDPDVLFHAGSEVIEMLMDLGTQAKVFQLDPESEQYQQEAAMALMEAERMVGQEALKSKKGPQLSAEAQDVWAWNVAKEVDSGQASPEYMQMVEEARRANSPVTAGVREALRRR